MAKRTYPVSSFDICLSNRCNLMCRYCYFDSINRGAPEFLTFPQIKKAVDRYVALVSVRGIDKVSVAGGEPFLDFPLLLKTVRYIRRACGPKVDIEIFTNGTLATPDKVRQLLACNGKLVLSLDGRKPSNDINRVFHGKKTSVYDAVMANFGALTPGERSRVCASMTVTAATAGELPENVKFLREAGFGEVQINLNLLETWSPARLAVMERSVARLQEYYSGLLRTSAKSFDGFRFGLEYILLKWDEDLRESGVFKEISIAPDGRFYPCGLVSTYGPQKRVFAIGTLEGGFDIDGMERLRARAVREIRRADRGVGLLEYLPNPMLLYFEARLKGLDRRRVFGNVRRLFKIFYDEMSPLLRMERMFDILSSDPRFGDFAHEPPFRAQRAVSSLRVAPERNPGDKAYVCPCGKGRVGFPGLSAQRRAVDLLLYSPGEEKLLVLNPESPADDFELAGLLAVYAGMKAAALGKKLAVLSVFRPGDLGPEELRFLPVAGLQPAASVTPGTAKYAAGFARAALAFDPGRLAEALRAVKTLAASGVRTINLEPSAEARDWGPAAAAFVNAMLGARGAARFMLENLSARSRSGGLALTSRRDGGVGAEPFSYAGRPGAKPRPVTFSGGSCALPAPSAEPFEAALRAALLEELRKPGRAGAFKKAGAA